MQLSGLTQLTELKLNSVTVDYAAEVSIQPMPSVRAVHLVDFELSGVADPDVGVQFCRIISTMFPNVHTLEVSFKQTRKVC